MEKSNKTFAKQDMLAWLDKQRDAVNDQTIALPPNEQHTTLPELQIINAIADRVRVMTAVEYLIGRVKICCDTGACRYCKFNELHRGYADMYHHPCEAIETREPLIAVEIVKRWKEERDEGIHSLRRSTAQTFCR